MASGNNSSSNSGPQDHYSCLGLKPGATFDQIQQAREKLLAEKGNDPLAKAKIEASYDALLMVSLKERQLGKASNAAVNASKREEVNLQSEANVGSAILTRLKGFNPKNPEKSSEGFMPNLALPEGQGLTIRLALGFFVFFLTLVSPKESLQLILSLSTLGLFISQVRRGRKVLPSLGWSISLLSIGLIIGGVLVSGMNTIPELPRAVSIDHLEALPAVVLIWLGSILLD